MKTQLLFGVLSFGMVACFAGDPVVMVDIAGRIDAPPVIDGGSWYDATVLAADGIQAAVVFDGSASFDPDQDLLEFVWYRREIGEHGQELLIRFADGVITTNSLGVGFWHLAVGVSDGAVTAIHQIFLDVTSPVMVLQNMRNEVEDEATPSRAQRLLLRKLDNAIRQFGNHQLRRGLHSVDRFQQLLVRRSAGLEPARVQALTHLPAVLLNTVSLEQKAKISK